MAIRTTIAALSVDAFVAPMTIELIDMDRKQTTIAAASATTFASQAVIVASAPMMTARKSATFPFGSTQTGGGGGGTITYYRLRGWNATTKQFEHWVGTSPTTPPPSFASLLEVSYVEFEA